MTLSVDIAVRRGGFDVVTAFAAAAGSTVALLGPNGAGKSTIVRALAGLEDDVEGSIRVDGTEITKVAPELRPIGVVFQDLRLFPHLSALENVAFPLRARGMTKADARARSTALLDRFGYPRERLEARPRDLSGGEGQRVAIARALIGEPRLLLLDEPTSSLDVRARGRIRPLIRETLEAFPGVRVLVTHDPIEAMTMADELVVIEEGRVSQAGTASDLRETPRSTYVAELVGVNLFAGRLEPIDPGAGRLVTPDGELVVAWPSDVPAHPTDGVLATLRPTDVVVHTAAPDAGSARNVLRGSIVSVSMEGERARVRIASSPPIVAEVTLGSVDRLDLREGLDVWASFKAVELRLTLTMATN